MELIHPTTIFQSKSQPPSRGNIGDVKLTSWGKFLTVKGGAKRPSNVERTCLQNRSFPTFFPVNVQKKDRDVRKSLRQDSSGSHKNTFDTPC